MTDVKVIPSIRHERAIPSRAERRGFADALYGHTAVRLGNCRVVPDGFIFDERRKRLYLFEVYVTHELTEDKLEKLRIIRDLLVDLGWTMRVAVAASVGGFRRMNWETGQAAISDRELRRAIERIGR